MAYFNNLFNAILNRSSPPVITTDTTIAEAQSRMWAVATRTPTFNPEKASQIAVVYTCVKILADSISRLNIDIYKPTADGYEVLDPDDPRSIILSYQPNNWQNKQKFWSATEYNLELQGNSYAKINRSWGSPTSLELIQPSQFVDYILRDGQLYYQFLEGKNRYKKVEYNASDILHFMNVSADGIRGISTIGAMRLSLGVHYEAYTTLKNTYEKELRSQKALRPPFQVPNAKKRKEIEDEFNEKYGGVDNMRTIVLNPGWDLIDLQINPKDAELLSTIQFTTKDIAAAFRIPAHMLNILESTKFSSVSEMNLDFLINTLGSKLAMYREELEFKLLTLEERRAGKTIKFNTNSILETDLKSRVDAYEKQIKGTQISINEMRIKEGLPPVEGGDELLVPSNYIFLSTLVKRANQAPTNNNADADKNI